MRTAAGRRALHVVLLMGGLFVLGVLCGERAQAADGLPSPRDVVGGVVGAPSERPREEEPRTVQSSGGSGLAALRPVTEGVVRSVEDRVERPVGDTVKTVAEGLGAAVEAKVPSLEELAPLPSSPSLPSAPPPPVLPDLSGLPDPATLPRPVLPADRTALHPGARAPEPDASDAAASDAADGTGAQATGGPEAPHTPHTPHAPHVAYGPEPVAGAAPSAPHADTRRTVPAPSGHAPARQSPTGAPDGALGSGTGADHGTPRHGDAHAVTPHHRITFRLVPGAVERADAAGTRDRYRDIPVSPA